MLLGFLGGSLFGYIIHGIFEIKSARKDAVMRDYIMRHPEYFPEPGKILQNLLLQKFVLLKMYN